MSLFSLFMFHIWFVTRARRPIHHIQSENAFYLRFYRPKCIHQWQRARHSRQSRVKKGFFQPGHFPIHHTPDRDCVNIIKNHKNNLFRRKSFVQMRFLITAVHVTNFPREFKRPDDRWRVENCVGKTFEANFHWILAKTVCFKRNNKNILVEFDPWPFDWNFGCKTLQIKQFRWITYTNCVQLDVVLAKARWFIELQEVENNWTNGPINYLQREMIRINKLSLSLDLGFSS